MESTDELGVGVAGVLSQAPEVLSIICKSVQKLFGLVRPSIYREQILNALQSIHVSYTPDPSKVHVINTQGLDSYLD